MGKIDLVAWVSIAALFLVIALLSGHSCNAKDEGSKSTTSSSGNIHTTSFLGVWVISPQVKSRDNHKCVASSCGDIHNISYPFRLEHDPKHCGDSSYTFECNNNVTMLRLYSGEYCVKEINYREAYIRVVDPGLEKNNCASLPRFPLAESNFSSLSLAYGPLSTPLTFLKCENPVHSSLYVDTASCIKSEAYGYVKVGTTIASDLEDGCSIDSTTMITTFARMGRNVSYKEIHKELVYGFQLSYEMTYVFVNCRGQWSLALERCFPHGITGFFQLLWEFIYHYIALPLYHLDDQFLLLLITIGIQSVNDPGLNVVTIGQIQLLNGWNYKKWRNQVEFYLSMHQNMDLCLIEEQPLELDTESTEEDRKYYKEWYSANRKAKNVIRTSMSDTIRGSIIELELAMDFLEAIGDKYQESDKAEAARLSKRFNELEFLGKGSVREHIMELIDLNSRLRDLDMGVKDSQVVHVALQSLPNTYSNLRTSYHAQESNWDLNKLISICVVEEERIRKEGKPTTAVNLVEKPKWKKQNKLKAKKTTTTKVPGKSAEPKAEKPFKFKCYFCKKIGHMKRDCSGFKAWMIKKGFNKQEDTK